MKNLFISERLQLRAFEPDDLLALHAYLNYPELAGRRYLPWRFPGEVPLSKQQVEGVLKHWAEDENAFHLAVILREDGTLIGHANCDWGWDAICPEIEVVISPAYQILGYGSELLALLLQYLFDNTPAHSIGSGMASWNQEAQKFARKHGFTQSGTMRRAGLRDGLEYNWLGVDLLRSEWVARSQTGGVEWH